MRPRGGGATFLITALVCLPYTARPNPRHEPTPFIFIVAVSLEGQPSGLSVKRLAEAFTTSLQLKSTGYVFRAEHNAGKLPCAGHTFCDHITIEESITETQDQNVQFVIRIESDPSGAGQHDPVKVPVDVIPCRWPAKEAKSWRQCPDSYADRIVLELEQHVSEAHPEFSIQP